MIRMSVGMVSPETPPAASLACIHKATFLLFPHVACVCACVSLGSISPRNSHAE